LQTNALRAPVVARLIVALAAAWQGRIDAIQQLLAVYRLFDVIERTATHRLDGSRHVSVTGNEDDRGVDTPREQFGLKLQPSQACADPTGCTRKPKKHSYRETPLKTRSSTRSGQWTEAAPHALRGCGTIVD